MFHGGNGIIREIEFKKEVALTILAQHRKEGPYGLAGGLPGQPGAQFHINKRNEEVAILENSTIKMLPGERFRLLTPGGGGWGGE